MSAVKRHTFAERLSLLMSSRSLNNRQLAQRSKVGEQCISRFVNGQRLPSLASLLRICNGLGVGLGAFDGIDAG